MGMKTRPRLKGCYFRNSLVLTGWREAINDIQKMTFTLFSFVPLPGKCAALLGT